MEEILIAIFQFLFEVVLQVIAELPLDLYVGSRESKRDQSTRKYEWIFVSLLMGGAVGGVSLLVRPKEIAPRLTFLQKSKLFCDGAMDRLSG
jgi:hypothetical protein